MTVNFGYVSVDVPQWSTTVCKCPAVRRETASPRCGQGGGIVPWMVVTEKQAGWGGRWRKGKDGFGMTFEAGSWARGTLTRLYIPTIRPFLSEDG